MLPLDAMLAPTAAAAVAEWKKPKWAEAGAPYPGLAAAWRAWRAAAPLRRALTS